MAVFDVCGTVDVAPGGSFQWTNSKAHGVKVQPASGSWPLPSSEYDIQPGATTPQFPLAADYGARRKYERDLQRRRIVDRFFDSGCALLRTGGKSQDCREQYQTQGSP